MIHQFLRHGMRTGAVPRVPRPFRVRLVRVRGVGRFFPADGYRGLLEALYPQLRGRGASPPLAALLARARPELGAWGACVCKSL